MILRKKPSTEFQTWHAILLVGVIVTASVLGVMQRVSQNADRQEELAPVERAVLNAETCAVSGGEWDACGDACRGKGAESVCIQVCVEYCMCASDDQCPFGYTCGDVVDGKGVCL